MDHGIIGGILPGPKLAHGVLGVFGAAFWGCTDMASAERNAKPFVSFTPERCDSLEEVTICKQAPNSELEYQNKRTRSRIEQSVRASLFSLSYAMDLALNPGLLKAIKEQFDRTDQSQNSQIADYFKAVDWARRELERVFWPEQEGKLEEWSRTLESCDRLHKPKDDGSLKSLEKHQFNDFIFNRAIHYASAYYSNDACGLATDERSIRIGLAVYAALFPDRLRTKTQDSYADAPLIERFLHFFSPSEDWHKNTKQFQESLRVVDPAGLVWLKDPNQREVDRFIESIDSALPNFKPSHSLSDLLTAGNFREPMEPKIGEFYKEAFYTPIGIIRAFLTHAPAQAKACFFVGTKAHLLSQLEPAPFKSWFSRRVDAAVLLWKSQELRDQKKREAEKHYDELLAKGKKAQEVRAREREAKELSDFHSQFQVVPHTPELSEFIGKLQGAAVVSKLYDRKQALLDSFEYLDFIDYRNGQTQDKGDPRVKEVVHAITSRANLTRLLRCYGFEQKYLQDYTDPSESQLEALAATVSKNYTEDEGIRNQINQVFFKEQEAVVLLASLFLSTKDVKTYIDVIQTQSRSEEHEKFKHTFLDKLRIRLSDVNTVRKAFSNLTVIPGSENKYVRPAHRPELVSDLEVRYQGLIFYWRERSADCLIVLRDNPKINFMLPAKSFNDIESASQEIETSISQLQYEAYERSLKEHNAEELRELGADITSAGDEIIRVQFRPAGLDQVLIPDKQEWYKLEKAVYEIRQFLEGRDALLERAEKLGVSCDQGEQGGYWAWSHGDAKIRGTSPEIVVSDFEPLEKFLQRIEDRQAQLKLQVEQEAKRQVERAAKQSAAALSVVPSDSSPVLIVDASVLMVLLAPVDMEKPDETYLGVLQEIARRENRRVYIPASVIFEVSGRALCLNANGKVASVEIRNYNHFDGKNISNLLAHAAHLRYGKDVGIPEMVHGSSHLVVTHGPLDVELFESAKVHADKWKNNVATRERFAQMQASQQHGDNSISEILGWLPPACRAVVATGDGSYVDQQMPWRREAQFQTQVTGWKSLVTHVLSLESRKSLGAAGLANAPKPEIACKDILDWIDTRGIGPGKYMRSDGDRVLGPRDLDKIL